MYRFIICGGAAVAAVIACNNNNANVNNFPTFQACYDEHTTSEGFGPLCATEICCIDHGIGSAAPNTVCGSNAQTCTTYVQANLMAGSSDPGLASDIMMACTFYVFDGMHGSGSSSNCGG